MSALWPILHYRDPDKALQFLERVVGFEADVVARDGDGDVVHAELGVPGGGRLVLGSTKHTEGVHQELSTGTCAFYLVTDDPAAIAHRVAGEGGGRIVQPPQRTQFGNGADACACTVADPEGNLWTFGDYRGGDRPTS